MPAASWQLYLIECIDGSVYTGITTDLQRRYAQHRSGKGARYTRAHPPARVLASFGYPDRASASRAEHAVKQLTSAAKRALCAAGAAGLAQLGLHCDPDAPLPKAPTNVQTIDFPLDREHVELNQLLKLVGLCDSGGAGKVLVASGVVAVDGVTELRKTCKIRSGQVVTLPDVRIVVQAG